jgi:DNA-binding XRE family transcriptional regulator
MPMKAETGFGARLKELREAAWLTQGDLAEACGVNRFSIAKVEQGLRDPSWPLALRLAHALGVSVAVFAPAEGTQAGKPGGAGPARPAPPARKAAPKKGKGGK